LGAAAPKPPLAIPPPSKLGGILAVFHEVGIACLLAAMPFLLFPSTLSVPALLILLLPWLARWRTIGHPTVRTPMDIPILCILLMLPVSL